MDTNTTAVDSIVNNSLGMPPSAGGAKTGGAATEDLTSKPSIVSEDVVSLSRDKKAAAPNTFDKVTLSRQVPRPLAAADLETADKIAGKLLDDSKLNRQEKTVLREERVITALAAMRMLTDSQQNVRKIWPGGIPEPTKEEMQEAYRRLTQKLNNPAAANDAAQTAELRVDMLEAFREQPLDKTMPGTTYSAA